MKLKYVLLTISSLIILIPLAGLITFYSEQKERARGKINSSFTNGQASSTQSGFLLNFFPSAPGDTPTPTPTPMQTFRHSRFRFSFDVPVGATVQELDPNTAHLVENAIAGAQVEAPGIFTAEIAVVETPGLRLEQYFQNRISMIFDETVVEAREASMSATLHGFRAYLENYTSHKDEILLFLPFRGSQIFEIAAVFKKEVALEAETALLKMVGTLKNY